MKVLFDTNIVLDHLLDRKPFVDEASKLFAAVEQGIIIGYLGATTITTTYYLISKTLGNSSAEKIIPILLKLFEIAPVTRLVLDDAVRSKFSDFEDAVLYHSATHVGVDVIASRDEAGFKTTAIPVYAPRELLKILTTI